MHGVPVQVYWLPSTIGTLGCRQWDSSSICMGLAASSAARVELALQCPGWPVSCACGVRVPCPCTLIAQSAPRQDITQRVLVVRICTKLGTHSCSKTCYAVRVRRAVVEYVSCAAVPSCPLHALVVGPCGALSSIQRAVIGSLAYTVFIPERYHIVGACEFGSI